MLLTTTTRPTPEISWLEHTRTMTQDDLPVLSYALSYPQLKHSGPGGAWISACYRRCAQVWQRRWEQVVYPRACLQQRRCLEHSVPFSPWECSLTGEAVQQQDCLLSLRFVATEQYHTRPDARLCWEDHWDTRTGSPLPNQRPKTAFQKISTFLKKGG